MMDYEQANCRLKEEIKTLRKQNDKQFMSKKLILDQCFVFAPKSDIKRDVLNHEFIPLSWKSSSPFCRVPSSATVWFRIHHEKV